MTSDTFEPNELVLPHIPSTTPRLELELAGDFIAVLSNSVSDQGHVTQYLSQSLDVLGSQETGEITNPVRR